jgi:hypothetical protein
MKFPELDEHGKLKEKLPNCPACGEDEVGLVNPLMLMCCKCNWTLEKTEPPKMRPLLPKIEDLPGSKRYRLHEAKQRLDYLLGVAQGLLAAQQPSSTVDDLKSYCAEAARYVRDVLDERAETIDRTAQED